MPDRLELHVLSASPPSGVAESQAQPAHAAAIPAGRPTETIDSEGLRANESSLAPVDRGLGAWSFVRAASTSTMVDANKYNLPQLLSAFIVEALVWGFPNAYGVFLLKYLEDPTWAHQKHASLLLPLVGPMASGFQYSAGAMFIPSHA
jgi:MCP family monocarboxylic acid transporter-like MFS transporter 10